MPHTICSAAQLDGTASARVQQGPLGITVPYCAHTWQCDYVGSVMQCFSAYSHEEDLLNVNEQLLAREARRHPQRRPDAEKVHVPVKGWVWGLGACPRHPLHAAQLAPTASETQWCPSCDESNYCAHLKISTLPLLSAFERLSDTRSCVHMPTTSSAAATMNDEMYSSTKRRLRASWLRRGRGLSAMHACMHACMQACPVHMRMGAHAAACDCIQQCHTCWINRMLKRAPVPRQLLVLLGYVVVLILHG